MFLSFSVSRSVRLPGFLLVGALLPSGLFLEANAATSSDTFQVTATVPDECTISATDLAFGSYSVTAGTAVDGSSSLSVTCSGGTAYEVSLDAGVGSGATVAARKMTSGSDTLDYTLYRDSGRTQVWGDTSGTNTLSGNGSGSGQTISVYGRITAAQTAAAGSYTDTVTATITF